MHLCAKEIFFYKSNFCVLKMWHMTDIQKGKDVWVEIVWGVSRIVVHWVKGGSDKTLTIIDNNEMTLLGNLASQPLQFMTELLMDLVPASHRTFFRWLNWFEVVDNNCNCLLKLVHCIGQYEWWQMFLIHHVANYSWQK